MRLRRRSQPLGRRWVRQRRALKGCDGPLVSQRARPQRVRCRSTSGHSMSCHAMQCHSAPCYAAPCCATRLGVLPTMPCAGCSWGRHDSSASCQGCWGIHYGMPTPFASQLWCGHGDRVAEGPAWVTVVPGLWGGPPLPGFSTKKQPKQDFPIHNPIPHEQ